MYMRVSGVRARPLWSLCILHKVRHLARFLLVEEQEKWTCTRLEGGQGPARECGGSAAEDRGDARLRARE